MILPLLFTVHPRHAASAPAALLQAPVPGRRPSQACDSHGASQTHAHRASHSHASHGSHRHSRSSYASTASCSGASAAQHPGLVLSQLGSMHGGAQQHGMHGGALHLGATLDALRHSWSVSTSSQAPPVLLHGRRSVGLPPASLGASPAQAAMAGISAGALSPQPGAFASGQAAGRGTVLAAAMLSLDSPSPPPAGHGRGSGSDAPSPQRRCAGGSGAAAAGGFGAAGGGGLQAGVRGMGLAASRYAGASTISTAAPSPARSPVPGASGATGPGPLAPSWLRHGSPDVAARLAAGGGGIASLSPLRCHHSNAAGSSAVVPALPLRQRTLGPLAPLQLGAATGTRSTTAADAWRASWPASSPASAEPYLRSLPAGAASFVPPLGPLLGKPASPGGHAGPQQQRQRHSSSGGGSGAGAAGGRAAAPAAEPRAHLRLPVL